MSKRFTIAFPSGRDSAFAHRVLNFAEDIYRQIEKAGIGRMCDIDRSRDVVWFEVHNSHDLGLARKVLMRELADHHLTADATVSES